MNLAKLNIVVSASKANATLRSFGVLAKRTANTATGAFSRLSKVFGAVTGAVFSLKGALVGLGIGLIARDFMKFGNFLEQTRFQMEAITKSTSKTNEILDNTEKFASSVAFSFQDLTRGAQTLTPVLNNNANDVDFFLRAVADISAVTGLSIEESSVQMQRALSAGIGSADQFRERGVTAMLGFSAGVSHSAEETKQKIREAFESGTTVLAGVAPQMSTTFIGVMSMIGDKLDSLKKAFLDAGVFDFFKAVANVIDKSLSDNIDSLKRSATGAGEAVTEFFMRAIVGGGRLIDQINSVGGMIGEVFILLKSGYDAIDKLAGGYLVEFGFIGFLFFGVKKALILTAVVTIFARVIDAIVNTFYDSIGKFVQGVGEILQKFGIKDLGEGAENYGKEFRSRESNVAKASGDAIKGFIERQMARLGIEDQTLQIPDFVTYGGTVGNTNEDAAIKFAKKIQTEFTRLREEMKEVEMSSKSMGDVVVNVTKQINLGFTDAVKLAGDVATKQKEYGTQLYKSLESGLENLMRTGKLNFKEFLGSLVQDFLIAQSKMAMADLFSSGVGAFGGIFNAFAYGGGKAGGGQVSQNKAYTVGERGRETFIPSSAGRIVPNGGEGGGVQIVQHFDFSNADEAIASRLARTAQNIKDETFNSVFGAINAGGQYAKVAGRR